MKKKTKIKGDEWSWEETSATKEAVERLHRDIKEAVAKEEDETTPSG